MFYLKCLCTFCTSNDTFRRQKLSTYYDIATDLQCSNTVGSDGQFLKSNLYILQFLVSTPFPGPVCMELLTMIRRLAPFVTSMLPKKALESKHRRMHFLPKKLMFPFSIRSKEISNSKWTA